MMLNPGIYYDMSRAQYDNIDALNYSGLKSLRKSPFHFKVDKSRDRIPTPNMLLGTALHLRVFQPELYKNTVITQTKRKTPKQEGDSIILHEDNASDIEAQWKAIQESPVLSNLLAQKNNATEVTLIWDDPVYDFQCKARLDFWSEQHNLILDLKTTRSVNKHDFTNQVVQYRYYFQAWWYRRGIEILTGTEPYFWIVAVEGPPYFLVRRYRFPESEMLRAAEEIHELCKLYSECLTTNKWEKEEDNLIDILLPGWAERGE